MAKIKGVENLRRNLRTLERGLTGATLDRICAESLIPLKEATESLAPRPSLKTGVAIAKHANRGQYGRTFWVAFKRGIAMNIAHLVEFGTAPHSMAKGASRRRGIMQDVPPFSPGTPPEPFFRPAFEATKDAVLRRVGQLSWAVVEAMVRGRS